MKNEKKVYEAKTLPGEFKSLRANADAKALLQAAGTTIEIHIVPKGGGIYSHGEADEITLAVLKTEKGVHYFGTNGSAHFRQVSPSYAKAMLSKTAGEPGLEGDVNRYRFAPDTITKLKKIGPCC